MSRSTRLTAPLPARTTLVHEYAWDFLHKGVAYLDIAAEELAKIGVHEESGRLLNPTQLDFAISPPVDTGVSACSFALAPYTFQHARFLPKASTRCSALDHETC